MIIPGILSMKKPRTSRGFINSIKDRESYALPTVLLNEGVGIVVVDRLEIFAVDLVPHDA
jgi:hypothetical protein